MPKGSIAPFGKNNKGPKTKVTKPSDYQQAKIRAVEGARNHHSGRWSAAKRAVRNAAAGAPA